MYFYSMLKRHETFQNDVFSLFPRTTCLFIHFGNWQVRQILWRSAYSAEQSTLKDGECFLVFFCGTLPTKKGPHRKKQAHFNFFLDTSSNIGRFLKLLGGWETFADIGSLPDRSGGLECICIAKTELTFVSRS